MLAKISSLFLLVSFLLLLFVSLSIPIIRSIYLFQLSADTSSSFFNSGASGSARFGVWGYCTSNLEVEVVGTDHSSVGQCSKAHLGYTFDPQVAKLLHVDNVTDAISATLSAALVLHVVDCILTFLALVFSLFVRKWRSRGYFDSAPVSRQWLIATLTTAFLAAILTTVTFIVDLVFCSIVRNKISDEADGVLSLSRGNAVAMAIAAAVFIWAAILLSFADVFVGRRRAKRAPQSEKINA
ncbi:actin cortical patch SUR7/pH-response regulator pali [Fomes fomentarius]|nr:actin cortical patch SUR7/pH-response regulator pali [Fomes fomentarius]